MGCFFMEDAYVLYAVAGLIGLGGIATYVSRCLNERAIDRLGEKQAKKVREVLGVARDKSRLEQHADDT